MKRASLLGSGLAVVMSLALAGSAMAAAFTNGGFESGTYTGGSWNTLNTGSTAITGWTVSSGTVDWVDSSYWETAEGSKSIDLDGNSAGALTSDSFSTVSGGTYFVSFALSGNPDADLGLKTVRVSASGSSSASADYSFNTSTMGNTHADMMYQTEGYTFVATGTGAALTFASQTAGAWGPVIDNVTVTQVATTGASCKDGGWATNLYMDSSGNTLTFKNQGQCVSYFATSGAVPIGN